MATANNVVKVLAGLCLMCSCPSTFSQSMPIRLHGTIVVIWPQDDRVLAAADSFSRGQNVGSTYTRCKLTPLGNTVIFSATGDTVFGDRETGKAVFVYDAHRVAKQTFERFKHERNTDLRTRRIANYWGETVRNRLSNYIATHPKATVKNPRGQILQGIFASVSEGQGWSIYTVPIEFGPVKTKEGLPTITSSVNSLPYGKNQIAGFGSECCNVLVAEFFEQQTQRSIAANNKMLETIKSRPDIDKDVFKIESAITAAEIWAPHGADFGGPIDILELTRKGIRWIQVKKECQDQH